MKQLFFFISFIFFSIILFSQTGRINQLNVELNSADSDSTRIFILVELANECRFVFPEDARKHLDKAFDLSKKTKNYIGEGFALKGLGNYFLDIGIYDSALYYYSKSGKIFEEIGDKKSLSEIMGSTCFICVAKGELNKALDSGHQSLKIALESGDSKEIQKANGFIGYVYRLIGDADAAKEHLLRGIEIADQNNDLQSKAALLSELARVYESIDQQQQAFVYYNEAYLIFRELDNLQAMAYANFYKGEIYRCRKEFNRAISQYAEAYKSFKTINDHFVKMRLVINLGKSYIALSTQGNSVYSASRQIELMGFNSIEEFLNKTCEELSFSNNKTDLLECNKLLAELSQIKGQFKKSFIYYSEYLTLQTEIQNNNKSTALAEMLIRFEEEEQDRELVLLKVTALANEEKIRLQRRQQIIIIIFAVLLIVVGFGLRNRIRVIRKTKAKLEEINQQLEEEKKRAEKSERFKEKFLTNVSHEIRTPMNAIMGITNLLVKKKHYKDQEKYLEAMSISARHLLGLINAILDLSKLEAGKVNLEESVFTIQEICNTIREELNPVYSRKGLYFNITIDKKIPDFLNGDSKMLYQILHPLCRNGIEFSDSGGIYLMSKLIGLTEKMAIIGFTVKDTGIGIRKELHDKLFSQVIGEVQFDKQEIESSGLELVLIKQMIELQGGSISIDSQPGKGTTFYFEIPYAIAKKEQKIDKAPDKLNPEKKIKKLKILLVEDNEFNIIVAQDELQSAIENVEIDIATNGKIAIEKVENNNYDIILMDVQMPIMNGYEATAAIRKMKGPKSETPIIAMTANIIKAEVDKCFEAGMNGYIPKPFDTEMLLNEVYKNL